ncbi:MAG: amidohydrolase [Rhodospirillaceae bacterium]|nr:amidohydrolase [Rhodospirillaceae bacterium]
MRIVDAHHHFWDLERNYYPWLSDHPEVNFFLGDYSALKSNYLPADYRRDANGFEIVATVHVEAEFDRKAQVAETAWLHDLAAAEALPSVVVGHVWLANDNCEEVLHGHMAYPLFRGVRSKPVTSLNPKTMRPGTPGTIQDPKWREGLRLLEKLGLTYDLRVPFWHLREAADAVGPHSNLKVVVNHTGFPWDRSDPGIAAWREGMCAISACPNVHLKLSELGLKDALWTVDSNRRVIREAVEIFGIDRCMWASNFPVARLRVEYSEQIEGILEILSDLSSEEIDRIFRQNASAFYRIGIV